MTILLLKLWIESKGIIKVNYFCCLCYKVIIDYVKKVKAPPKVSFKKEPSYFDLSDMYEEFKTKDYPMISERSMDDEGKLTHTSFPVRNKLIHSSYRKFSRL